MTLLSPLCLSTSPEINALSGKSAEPHVNFHYIGGAKEPVVFSNNANLIIFTGRHVFGIKMAQFKVLYAMVASYMTFWKFCLELS